MMQVPAVLLGVDSGGIGPVGTSLIIDADGSVCCEML